MHILGFEMQRGRWNKHEKTGFKNRARFVLANYNIKNNLKNVPEIGGIVYAPLGS